MANMGEVKSTFDGDGLSIIIVKTLEYKFYVEEKVTQIKACCKTMTENESLKGGRGDVIVEAFEELAKAADSVVEQLERFGKKLDAQLDAFEKTLNNKGISAGVIEEARSKAQKVAVKK